MKLKKFIAVAMVSTMTFANCLTAFASGVDGAGIVEYDNSVDVTYDSITVPTLTGSKYDFQLDPTDKLHGYDSATYARGDDESNPGVYFHSEKTAAKIEQLASTDDGYKALFTLSKEPVASDATDWKEVVTAVDSETGAATVTGGYYVWTPADWQASDLVENTTATGKKGVYTELTGSNIKNYFDIGEKDAQDKYEITMKTDHLAGNSVCDGKLYKDTYTAMSAAIVDNKPTTNIDDYIEQQTVEGVTSIKTVKNVYVANADNSGYEMAATGNIKFTPAVAAYQATTDKVVVTNKSTKKKTVKAVVTMSNIDGLTFADADTFTNDTTASVYFKATDGTAANDAVLVAGDTTATATYTLDINGADLSAAGKQITYQGGINTKTGGHNYYKYEAVGTTYNSNSFWITAKANTNSGAAEAWKTYGEALEARYDEVNEGKTENFTSVKPVINILYTVTDYQEAPTTYTVTYKANYTDGPDDATESVAANGNPTGPSTAFTREGYTLAGWATAADGTAAALSTFTITEATTLFAIWTQNVVTGTLTVQRIGQNTYATIKGADNANLEEGKLTSLKINDVDFTSAAIFYEGLYGVKGADLVAADIDVASGSTLTAVYTVDGTDYTASYTMP